MTTRTILSRCLALALAGLLAGATGAFAQEGSKDKDEALDALLKKLDDSKPSADQPAEKAKDDAKADEKKEKSAEGKKGGEQGSKSSGEVAPKDKALDGLLEKLGKTEETPAPEERKPAGGGADKPPMPGEPKPGEPKPGERKADQPQQDKLQGKEKDLDEHLEELLGRKRKKKGEEEQEGEGGGPLSKIIKEMREVEQRLGKPDTGEETRQKQEDIVKNIDQIIEQIKNSPSGGQGTRIVRVRQQGKQPSGQQGGPGAQAQGKNAQGTGPMKPSRPQSKDLAGNDKDTWGHLPAFLRGEMDNVSKEKPLPGRMDLISRYYKALAKKSQSQPE